MIDMAYSEYQWMDIFSGNLRELMRESRMTQRELAKESGLSEAMISRYLNKKCMPSVAALSSIAHVFPCANIDELLYFGDRVETRI